MLMMSTGVSSSYGLSLSGSAFLEGESSFSVSLNADSDEPPDATSSPESSVGESVLLFLLGLADSLLLVEAAIDARRDKAEDTSSPEAWRALLRDMLQID